MQEYGATVLPAEMEIPQEERIWAVAAHAGALIFVYLSGGLLSFLVPLIIYLIKGNESDFVRHASLQALYFSIGSMVLGLLMIILVVCTFGIGVFIAIPLGIIFFLVYLFYGILAVIRTFEGKYFTYPLLG